MMELSGLRIDVSVGDFEAVRVPRWWIESERHHIVGRAGITLYDPDRQLYREVEKGAPVQIHVGYRNRVPADWRGYQSWKRPAATPDEIEIGAVDGARALINTLITQGWENETPEAIVRYAVRQAGLAPGRIDSPGMTLPRFVASGVPAWYVARLAAETCQRGFDRDMSRWALWLGAGGVNWGDFDEPGEIPVIETGELLIEHRPADGPADRGMVETFLLPELTHSRLFRLRDARRGIDQVHRAQRVRHEGEPDRARTFLWYGPEAGV